MAKIKIKQINDLYNLIIIERKNIFEYFLEKENYGNLFYMFGLTEKLDLQTELIMEYIEIAEEQKFWGEE